MNTITPRQVKPMAVRPNPSRAAKSAATSRTAARRYTRGVSLPATVTPGGGVTFRSSPPPMPDDAADHAQRAEALLAEAVQLEPLLAAITVGMALTEAVLAVWAEIHERRP